MLNNQELEPVFCIPTYRLRDVKETIIKYDQHFHDMKREVPIWIFDDSPYAFHKRYFPELEKTPTYNEVFYIGPEEKGKYKRYLRERTGIMMADSVIGRIFRQSHGGNRNFILAYTLGRRFISSDDDMEPRGLITKEREKLEDNVVMSALSIKPEMIPVEYQSNDIYGAFFSVLGEKPLVLPFGTDIGEYALDSNCDLFTNTTIKRDSEKTKLTLEQLKSSLENTIIKIAQSFITGTSDMDSIDLGYMFINDPESTDIDKIPNVYVLEAYKPFITKQGWRLATGVSGYDNRDGLPPFFPTKLRFEDYIFRIWSQRKEVATAHVNCIQHHTRNVYMRESVPYLILNETIAKYLKDKIRESVKEIKPYSIDFEYDGLIDIDDINPLLENIKEFYSKVLQMEKHTKDRKRKEGLKKFSQSIYETFFRFEPDHFLSEFSQIVDEEIFAIKDCMSYWQMILEITMFKGASGELPVRRLANPRKAC